MGVRTFGNAKAKSGLKSEAKLNSLSGNKEVSPVTAIVVDTKCHNLNILVPDMGPTS